MKKRWLIAFLMLLLLMPIGLWGVLGSEAGSRWLINTISPKELSIQTIQGDLLSHLELQDLHYQTDGENISVSNTVFAWQPSQLWLGTLKIVDVSIHGVSIELSDKAKSEEPSEPFDFDAPLALPLDIALNNFSITDLQFQQGKTKQTLEKLKLSAQTEQGYLKIPQLELNANPLVANLEGQVELGKGFAFNLKTVWQFQYDTTAFKAITRLHGNTKQITLKHSFSTPFRLALKTIIKNPLKQPYINARLVWRDFNYPFTGNKDIQSTKGRITVDGLLSDYRLKLNAALQQQYLPDTQLILDSQGSLDAINIKKLDVVSKTGKLQINGHAGWKDKTTFDIQATGQEFNPAIIAPDITGNLSFNSQFKGQMTDKLQLTAAIDKLTGQLRGYPVSLDGKFALLDNDLTVNALNLDSGRNHIAVNGTLGSEQAALTININAPELHTLWKGLTGNLAGQAHLQGMLINPSVQLELTGQGISFAEHGVQSLKLGVNYDATGKQVSELQLTAKRLKTGTTNIANLTLNGQGTPVQHNITTELNSDYGDLNVVITGALKDKNWQGALAKLNIRNKEFGAWQLSNALNIQAQQTDSGININTSKTCLTQQSAALCLQGTYAANGDFSGQLAIQELSSHLIAAYLPNDIRLQTELNADAKIAQTKGTLTGDYQIKLSPITLGLENKTLELGTSAITGKINGTRINSDLNISLFAQDYIKGQVQLNTDNSQTLSGQLITSIKQFEPIKAFVPELASITGNLDSQIKLAGSLKKPLIQGNINLNNGNIKVADTDLSVHDINLQIQATSSESNHIVLKGSLAPELASNKPDAVQVATHINLSADIQQRADHLTGQYQLDIPPTILKLPNANLPLGATLLTGKLSNQQLFADLKLALIKQDYLKAQLQLALNDSKTLAGNINAAISEFAAFNPLVPQLSNLKGQLQANLTLAGTTEKPIANGTVGLNNAGFNLAELGLQLKNINLQAQSLKDHIQLKGMMQSGEGQIKLNGALALNPETGFPLDLTVIGENFEVARLSEAEIAISPQLKVAYAKTAANITGKVLIPKAVIQLQEVPESAISVSEDEVILGESEQQAEKIPPTPINAKIDLELGKNVNFTGLGLKTDLQGKLQFNKAGEKMAMYGMVNMDKARFKSYGQDLTVRKGKFVFNGATDRPNLDVEAIRVSVDKKITAIISVQGTPDKLRTRIYSEPSLPETEALAYLITGKPMSQVSKDEGNMIAGAALSYGAGQASWLTQKLGIDEFEVQEGKNLKDTLLAVGEYITPDFYVGAKVGLFNKQVALVLKHKLTDSLNVETQAGESQRIKLNYEIDTN